MWQAPRAAAEEDALYSRLYSSPGVALNLGSYSAELELQFGATVPANTWTYIRIEGDDTLFDALLGGTLGNSLAGLLGTLLLGRQEIRVQAVNSSGGVVLTRTSFEGFNTTQVRMVMDKTGEYHLAVKPTQAYDRIRIRNSSAAGVGLGAVYTLDVYHAFYFESEDHCTDRPVFTSFDGSGVTLDLLGLNQQSQSLFRAIDGNANTSSEISLGVLGLNGTAEQLIYFNTPVQPGDEVPVKIGKDASLLDLDLLNFVSLVAYFDGVEVSSQQLSSLLELDLLGLFASGQFFEFPIGHSISPIDRIGIRASSLLSLGLLEGKLLVNAVHVAPSRPVVESLPENGQYIICEGSSLTIAPKTQAGKSFRWYQDWQGVDFLDETPAYTIPSDLPPGEYEYFIKSKNTCGIEGLPSSFKVKVLSRAELSAFDVLPSELLIVDESGNYRYSENSGPVVLKPFVLVPGEGTFEWYFDTEMQDLIQHGTLREDIMYELTPAGELSVSGLPYLDENNSHQVYLNWIPDSGCPSSSPKEINLFSQLRVLPIVLMDFTADKIGSEHIRIAWRLGDQSDSGAVRLSRASSDLNFSELAIIHGNPGESQQYEDHSPANGMNYYRLEVLDEVGISVLTSALKSANFHRNSKEAFKVFPNHFDHHIQLQYSKKERVQAEVFLYSGKGSLLRREKVEFTNLNNEYTLEELQNYPTGNYVLQIITRDDIISLHLIKK